MNNPAPADRSPDGLSRALERLPHGPGFRFLDEVTALEPGASGRAIYRLRGDEEFLRGHFPGRPILPAVVMLEMIAQLAGAVAQSDPAHPPIADLRLAAVRAAKISGTAEPGAVVEIEVTCDARIGSTIHANGRVTAEGRELARAEVVLGGAG